MGGIIKMKFGLIKLSKPFLCACAISQEAIRNRPSVQKGKLKRKPAVVF